MFYTTIITNERDETRVWDGNGKQTVNQNCVSETFNKTSIYDCSEKSFGKKVFFFISSFGAAYKSYVSLP